MRPRHRPALAALLGALLTASSMVTAFPVSDTGQVICYDGSATPTGTVTAGTPDPEASGFDGQDCTGGAAAVDAIGQQAKLGGSSVAGRDYSKIANNGSVLPNSATRGSGPTDWGCTRDNLTGLVWELRPDDGGQRDQDNRFTHAAAVAYADTINNLPEKVCGYSTWRLPTPFELESLLAQDDPGSSRNQIDRVWFPDQVFDENNPFFFWTATTSPDDAMFAWVVDFDFGWVGLATKADPLHVRLVVGEPPLASPGAFSAQTVGSDVVVTDARTGLMWSKCVEGLSGESCPYDPMNDTIGYTWAEALQRANTSNHAGFSDWRLPTVAELGSLRDYTSVQALTPLLSAPTAMGGQLYWSSTSSPRPSSTTTALTYNFDAFAAYSDTFKSNLAMVRLVRGGNHLNAARSTDADFAPETFTLTDVAAPAGTLVQSNSITVAGLTSATALFVSGAADSQYAVNGGSYTARAGAVRNGDTVRVRHTASATAGATTSTTLNIGGVSEAFVTTSESLVTATKLAFFAQPTTATAGVAFANPVAHITDDAGTVVTAATNSVTLARQSGPGTLSCDAMTVAAVAGIATFTNCRVSAHGTYALSATATGLTSATSTAFDVTAALAFSGQPTVGTAGVAFTTQPTVAIRDGNGQTIASATDSITLAKATGPGELSCAQTTVNAVGGIANFSGCRVSLAGTYTLTATAPGTTPANALSSATTDSITVTAGAASKLAFSVQPVGGAAGAPFTIQPTVQVQDASGNPTNTGAVITLEVNAGPGVLSGTATRSATNGEASFTGLRLSSPGDYTLKATAAGLQDAISATLSIGPAVPALLMFSQLPSQAVPGDGLLPFTVTLRNNSFDTVRTATDAVTLSADIAGSLVCPQNPVNAIAGVATFAGCRLVAPGLTTLTATSGALSASSTSINVAEQIPQKIIFDGVPTRVALSTASLRVKATGGSSGNPVTFSAGPDNICTSTPQGVVSLRAVGVCAIEANQEGNATHLPGRSAALVTISNAVPPGPVTQLDVTPFVRSLEITFTPPVDTGGAAITSYGYEYRPATGNGAKKTGRCVLPCTVTNLAASGDASFTGFTVWAINAAGAGPRVSTSKVVLVPTSSGAATVRPPTAPGNLRVEYRSGVAVALRWDPSVSTDTGAIEYSVEAWRATASPPATPVGKTADNYIAVRNLSPSTNYRFRVRAVLADGTTFGPYSNVVSQTTTNGKATLKFVNPGYRTVFPEGFTGPTGILVEVDDDGGSPVTDVLFGKKPPNDTRAKKLLPASFPINYVMTRGVSKQPTSERLHFRGINELGTGTRLTTEEITITPVNDPPELKAYDPERVTTDPNGGTVNRIRDFFVAKERTALDGDETERGQDYVGFFVEPDPGNASPSPISNVSIAINGTLRFTVDQALLGSRSYVYGFYVMLRDNGEDHYNDGVCRRDRVYGPFDQRACSAAQRVTIVLNGPTGVSLANPEYSRVDTVARKDALGAATPPSEGERPLEQQVPDTGARSVTAADTVLAGGQRAMASTPREGLPVFEQRLADAFASKGELPLELEDPDTEGEYLDEPETAPERSYRFEVSNLGNQPLVGAGFTLPLPDGLSDISWTCEAPIGVCTPASGNGAVNVRFDLGAENGIDKAVILLTGTPTTGTNWVQLYPQALAPAGASVDVPSDSEDLVEPVTEDAVFLGSFEGGAR